jgi:hypothetical protein
VTKRRSKPKDAKDAEPAVAPERSGTALVRSKTDAVAQAIIDKRAEDDEARRRRARAVFRASEGWAGIDGERAMEIYNDAELEYENGKFLIERLGAQRELDPKLMATLLQLRQRLMAEHEVSTAAESMLVDQVVIAYYNILRINGWIGDAALLVEHHLFGQESPTAKLRRSAHREVAEGLVVEDHVQRMIERITPSLDRLNRMFVRNLNALRDLKHAPVPNVAIGRVDQVNVAHQQANVVAGRP